MDKSKNKGRGKLASDLRAALDSGVRTGAGLSKGSRLRASHQVIDRAQDRSLEPVNIYEQKSISALLLWAANEQKAAPETVAAITEVRFNVEDVSQLPRRDYEEVIKFLIDLRIDEMKN